MPLPALTIYQPWCSLIAVGAKRFETRSWAPPVRHIGYRWALHAGAQRPTPSLLRGLTVKDTQAMELALGIPLGGWQRLPLASVVAFGKLAGAYRVGRRNGMELETDALVPGSLALDRITLNPTEDVMGDYSAGRWLWWFDDVAALKTPIPAKGRQGVWHYQRERTAA